MQLAHQYDFTILADEVYQVRRATRLACPSRIHRLAFAQRAAVLYPSFSAAKVMCVCVDVTAKRRGGHQQLHAPLVQSYVYHVLDAGLCQPRLSSACTLTCNTDVLLCCWCRCSRFQGVQSLRRPCAGMSCRCLRSSSGSLRVARKDLPFSGGAGLCPWAASPRFWRPACAWGEGQR